MATKTLSELQTEEELAKSEIGKETPLYKDDKVGGIGLALMGFGMGLKHQGGDFLRVVEAKKQAIKNERMAMFEQAKQDRMDREAKMERDRDRALQMQRHNDSMNMQRMNASMSAMKNTVDLIADGNYRGAEMYSVAASKKLGSDYVRYHKKADGTEVMINFPANIDSKPIMGALQAGDPTYRLNDKNFVERYNPETQSYENTGWRGTLGTAYRLGGVGDDVGKGVVTVLGEDGKPKLMSRREAVATGATPIKDASNIAKGQTFVSSLSPELQKFAKESYGVDENGVVDTKQINKDYFASKKATEEKAVGAEKDQMVFENRLEYANTVMGKIDESFKIIDESETTATGFVGQVSSSLYKGGAAGSLESQYTTIKAITSFENLQNMRDASKTGGALGSITEGELKLLGSTTAELDAGLDPEVQRRHLKDTKKKYTRTLVKASFGNEAAQAGFKKPRPTKVNGERGWMVMDRFVPDTEMQEALGETMYNKMLNLVQ